MPGHSAAAMAAYPEFSCNPSGGHTVWSNGGISTDIINVANPAAVQFAKDVLERLWNSSLANIFTSVATNAPLTHGKKMLNAKHSTKS